MATWRADEQNFTRVNSQREQASVPPKNRQPVCLSPHLYQYQAMPHCCSFIGLSAKGRFLPLLSMRERMHAFAGGRSFAVRGVNDPRLSRVLSMQSVRHLEADFALI